jgi:hypothetical protein
MDASVLNSKLDKGLITSDKLLSKSKLLDTDLRGSPEYGDPRFFPFYFYLGQQLQSEAVLQIGSQIGLVGACFLQGCRTVEHWLSMDRPVNHHRSLVCVTKSNIQKFCGGKVDCLYFGEDFKTGVLSRLSHHDTIFISEKFDKDLYKDTLEFSWKHLIVEGLLIADYINTDELRDVFDGFCRVKNRVPEKFNTRYGVGVLQR